MMNQYRPFWVGIGDSQSALNTAHFGNLPQWRSCSFASISKNCPGRTFAFVADVHHPWASQRNVLLHDEAMGKITEISAEKRYEATCNEQGWSAESQIIHLEGFIRGKGLFEEFAAYAADAAKEENEPIDTSSMPSCDRLE